MFSFYGGQQGKNFEISKIFRNKVQMQGDLLKKAWTSDIGVDDLVFIAYGLPNDPAPAPGEMTEYAKNAAQDEQEFGKTYNGTLWQKIYTDSTLNLGVDELTGIETFFGNKDSGLGYRLIASLTGATPYFVDGEGNPGVIIDNTVRAGEEPRVSIDASLPDRPKLTIGIPKSWKFEAIKNLKPADMEPVVSVAEKDLDTQLITFDLPSAYQFKLNEGSHSVPPGNQPEVSLNKDPNFNINNTMVFDIKVPESQNIKLSNKKVNSIPAGTVDPDGKYRDNIPDLLLDKGQEGDPILEPRGTLQEPVLELQLPKNWSYDPNPELDLFDPALEPAKSSQVEIITLDENTKKFKFTLPKEYTIGNSVFVPLSPEDSPYAKLAPNSENSRELTFEIGLPREIKFHYGDIEQLGQTKETIILSGLSITWDFQNGDYYIDINSGFIYYLTDVETLPDAPTQIKATFVFVACLAGQPGAKTELAKAFTRLEDQSIVQTVPKVEKIQDIDGKFYYKFNLPESPKISATVIPEASTYNGDNIIQTINEDLATIDLEFHLPEGAQWFEGVELTGNSSSAVIADAKDGDFYLNISDDDRDLNRGNVYKLEGSNWRKVGNIRGNTGNGIASIQTVESQDDGGSNQVTINYINSSMPSSIFYIKNGTKGNTGEAAGFGVPTISKSPIALEPDQPPVVNITTSGPDTAKVFDFEFQIPKGDKGDTGSVGPQGAIGPQGPTGNTGPKGDPGKDFIIKGYYNNFESLQQEVLNPEPGDAYGVGASEPYDIYVYDGAHSVWINNGSIQGPIGPQGDIGPVGPQGPIGLSGNDGISVTHEWKGTKLSITSASGTSEVDLKGEKGESGDIGPQGPAGKNGLNGVDGVNATHSWEGSILTITSASGTSSADLKGPQGLQGPPGNTGSSGKDGVSIAHQWKGTVLEVTSASGTTSMDLKGPTGDTGPQGPPGESILWGTFDDLIKQQSQS